MNTVIVSSANSSFNVRPVIVFNNDQELCEYIRNYKGCSMLTLESTVIYKHNVKSYSDKTPFSVAFPKGEIFCTKREYVLFGNANYGRSVNKQRVREGLEPDFEPKELPYGEWLEGSSVVIVSKGEYQLRYYPSLNPNYQYSEKVYHYENGDELTDEEKNLFWTEYNPPKKGAGYYQGVQKGVEVRNVKFAGITRLVFAGKIYVRKGFESREDKKSISLFNDLAETVIKLDDILKEIFGE
jgi:hypothetical protein